MLIELFGVITILSVVLPQLTSVIVEPKDIPGQVLAYGHYIQAASLTISPTGQVVDCKVNSSSSLRPVDDSLCRQFRASRFLPGTGQEGVALLSKIRLSYAWPDDGAGKLLISDIDLTVEKLPSPSPLHPWTELALMVDARGDIESCDIAKSSGTQALETVACRTVANTKIKPLRDEKGVPAESVQSLVVGFGAYSKLVFKTDSHYASLGDAGPYTPDRAVRLGVQGYASLACSADPGGKLTGCVVDEESPLGFGFGRAAERMAKVGWMQVAPDTSHPVLVRVDFTMHPSSSPAK